MRRCEYCKQPIDPREPRLVLINDKKPSLSFHASKTKGCYEKYQESSPDHPGDFNIFFEHSPKGSQIYCPKYFPCTFFSTSARNVDKSNLCISDCFSATFPQITQVTDCFISIKGQGLYSLSVLIIIFLYHSSLDLQVAAAQDPLRPEARRLQVRGSFRTF